MSKKKDRRGPKERLYDEEIAPLMRQIITACKHAKINMAATFMLDPQEETGEPLQCTTVLPLDPSDEAGTKRIAECRAVMYPRPMFAAFTITGGAK
jgi:hypothetical protein